MTSGILSGVVTAVLMLCFIAGVAWAWSGRRKREFDEAARIPLEHESPSSKEHG